MCQPYPYIIKADENLVERIARNDMVRGITVACGGFFGPQGRQLRVPLVDPHQNEKIESFEYDGMHITNFEMESSALAGLAKLMGHRATTACMVIANRRAGKANTGYKNIIDKLIPLLASAMVVHAVRPALCDTLLQRIYVINHLEVGLVALDGLEYGLRTEAERSDVE